jgi:hypothetical protein
VFAELAGLPQVSAVDVSGREGVKKEAVFWRTTGKPPNRNK